MTHKQTESLQTLHITGTFHIAISLNEQDTPLTINSLLTLSVDTSKSPSDSLMPSIFNILEAVYLSTEPHAGNGSTPEHGLLTLTVHPAKWTQLGTNSYAVEPFPAFERGTSKSKMTYSCTVTLPRLSEESDTSGNDTTTLPPSGKP